MKHWIKFVSGSEKIEEKSKEIFDLYKLNRIFVLQEENKRNFFIVFNTKDKVNLKDTILTHKNDQYNSYFTINGLNALIKSRIGIIDHSYVIPWYAYQNTLITGNQPKIRKFKFYTNYHK